MIAVPPGGQLSGHYALGQEDVDHVVEYVDGDRSYGDLVADLWDAGDPFVLLEHDVVPFPGAVLELAGCSSSWCARRFPVYPNNLVTALGMVKLAPCGPPAPAEWRSTRWQDLEAVVVPYLRRLFEVDAHVHEPAVAHARPELVRGY